MTEVTLEFLARQGERILQELADARKERAEARAELADARDGLTVLTDMVLKLARDMVRVKDMLGRMDSRVSGIEGGSRHE
jgi:hypothetical protein